MIGKKVASLSLALVLLIGLCACTKSNVETDNNWFEDSLLTNTAFTREALSKNPLVSINDDYDDVITAWTGLFVEKNYAAHAVNTSTGRVESFTLSTKTSGKQYFLTAMCQAEFPSAVAPEGLKYGKLGYQVRFQMVLQCANEKFSAPFTLIGFVTNQERQIIEPFELYNFIKDTPTYKGVDYIIPQPMKLVPIDSMGDDFTEKTVDDTTGLSIINMRAVTSGLDVYDFALFPGNLLAALAINPVNKDERIILVYKADEMHLLYKQTFSDSKIDGLNFENNGQEPVLFETSDWETFKYYAVTQTGLVDISETAHKYHLSDLAVIIRDEDGLSLEKNGVRTLLLKNVEPRWEADSSVANLFFCGLSDTRFVYNVYDCSWCEGSGIYDIETGEDISFEHKNASILEAKAYGNGRVILAPVDWSDYESYGPYLYDETTRELVDLDLMDVRKEDDIQRYFCLCGNTLAVFTDDDPISTLRVFDISTKTEIMHIDMSCDISGNYYGGGIWSTEKYIWFYSIPDSPPLLRVPIKRSEQIDSNPS